MYMMCVWRSVLAFYLLCGNICVAHRCFTGIAGPEVLADSLASCLSPVAAGFRVYKSLPQHMVFMWVLEIWTEPSPQTPDFILITVKCFQCLPIISFHIRHVKTHSLQVICWGNGWNLATQFSKGLNMEWGPLSIPDTFPGCLSLLSDLLKHVREQTRGKDMRIYSSESMALLIGQMLKRFVNCNFFLEK